MPFLHPQMQAVLKKSNDLVPSYSLLETPLPIVRENYAKERNFWNVGGPKISVVKDDDVPGPIGKIPIRIFHPNTEFRLPILLYLHGGGYVLGSIDTHNRIIRELSFRSGCVVIGVDYSLSPEQKFPVALVEIGYVLKWLIKKSASNKKSPYYFDSEKIVIGGDSAGANLSIGTALNFKNCLSGLLLIYGWYGLRDSCSSRIFANKLDGMGEDDLKYYTKSYIRSPVDLSDVRINALGADLNGLPPSCIIVSDIDPLLDDSKALAYFLEENGVPCEMHLHRGVLHGFLHYTRMLDASVEGLEQCANFLKKILFD